MKQKRKKFWRAETLLEVLVALGVVAAGAATAANLTIMALDANQYNKDQLVALNLAQAAVEDIRNVRDTNFLKFSSDKTDCWNMADTTNNCDSSNKSGRMLPGDYTLNFGEWDKVTSGPLNLSNGVDASDENYHLYNFNVFGIILVMHQITGFTPVAPTNFYLDAHIDYQKTDAAGNLTAATGPGYDDANVMVINTKVQWLDKGKVREIQLNTMLSNYKEWN